MDILQNVMTDLFEYLGFGDKSTHKQGDYNDVAKFYNVKELESEHEARMQHYFGYYIDFLAKNVCKKN